MDFADRLRETFENASIAEVARRLDLPHATVRNYFGGRMPAPEVLAKIGIETNVSLNWLLTGSGERYINASPREISLEKLFEDKIKAIVRAELADRENADLTVFAGFVEKSEDYDSFSDAVMKFLEEKK